MKKSEAIAACLDEQYETMRLGFETADANLITDGFYAPDAWVVGGDEMTWAGSDKVRELYQGIVGAYVWEQRRERLVMLGDDAAIDFLIGKITPVEPGEPLIYKLQFTWQYIQDEWKCVSQFFAHGTTFQ